MSTASSSGSVGSGGRRRTGLVLKEEYLDKYAGRLFKTWHKRYFVLSPQSLCYFKINEDSPTVTASADRKRKDPRGRVFLATITEISLRPTKRKQFAFLIRTGMGQKLLLAASSEEQMSEWIESIKKARADEEKEEKTSKFRQSLRRLKNDLKRVSLVKEGGSIGCTIKIAGGPVLVNRILEEGPIAQTGVLKPGDQILDIHGKTITGLSMEEIVKVIRDAPAVFVATIRPTTSLQRPPVDPEAPPPNYAVLDYNKMAEHRRSSSSTRSTGSVGDFNEPGLSSDEVTDDDITSVNTAAGDDLSVQHTDLEVQSIQGGMTDKPRSTLPHRSRSPRLPRSCEGKISSGSEKSQSEPPKVNYVELEWGNDGGPKGEDN
jgi:hypothetical protein